MQIKRFEAEDMQEALRQVKEAMGPEAIILSTKTINLPSARSGTGNARGWRWLRPLTAHHEPSSGHPVS